MPIILYSVREARDWLEGQGRKITEKGLRRAMERGDLPFKIIGSLHVVCEDDLRTFWENQLELDSFQFIKREKEGKKK